MTSNPGAGLRGASFSNGPDTARTVIPWEIRQTRVTSFDLATGQLPA